MTVTGIELGPDYCVLVRARRRGAAIEVTAVRIFEAGEWAVDLPARIELLRGARRLLALPGRATVVAWDLAVFGVGASDAMLRAAGFNVDAVLTPSDALARLAWSRPATELAAPVAWLSINRHGAALAVVRDHDLIYGREFAWGIRAPEQRAQAHLLRRYLYVAQLVPEIRKAMDVVRSQQNASVETAVACGNIPDLRSFTMPLIEQLDIEFETLDSLEGLHVTSQLAGAVSTVAPAIRLAGAAAAFGRSGTDAGAAARWVGAAAALVLAAGAAWWAVSVWSGSAAPPERPPRDTTPVVSSQGRRRAPPPLANTPEPAPADSAMVRASAQATPPDTSRQKIADARSAPAAVEEAMPRPQPTTGNAGREGVTRLRMDMPPLPAVGGILISQKTRLAVIDGVVVGVGDAIAGRVVARIEPDAVIFREPSGEEVRVQVRDRQGS